MSPWSDIPRCEIELAGGCAGIPLTTDMAARGVNRVFVQARGSVGVIRTYDPERDVCKLDLRDEL